MDRNPGKTKPVPIPAWQVAAPFSRSIPSHIAAEGGTHTAIVAPGDPPLRTKEDVLRDRARRRQRQEIERLKEEAEIVASLRRIRNTVLLVVGTGAVTWTGWWLNQKWGGQWPILFTWAVMATAILVGFGWMFWYLDQGD